MTTVVELLLQWNPVIKMNITGSSGRINGENYKALDRLGFQNVAVGRINGVVALYENVWSFRPMT